MGQFTRFLELLSELEGRGITFPIRHCAASAAVLKYPCTHQMCIRDRASSALASSSLPLASSSASRAARTSLAS